MAKEEKQKNKNIHEVIIKIEKEEWKEAVDQAFRVEQKTAKVDGFRKGKVPRNIYEKNYGKETLLYKAADALLQKAYDRAIEESKLEPVVQPSVDLKTIDEEKVEYTFKIITKPELKIKKYKGLKVKPETVKVTKEEIEHELSHILERYTELVTKEKGKVEEGNIAIIDYEGFKDGEAFEGGKGENYPLEIGSHTFIPGFEEQVVGMKTGEEKDLHVTFPDDYMAEDLKGKEVVFKVKVNEIKEKQTRELDKDFFEDLGMEGVDSKEKLEEEIKNSIKSQKDADAENKYIDTLLEEVAKNVEVDLPEEMVEEEVNLLLNRFENRLKSQGIGLDVYYSLSGTSEESLRNQLEKEAYSNVLYRLMLEEIMVLEKVEVTDEEVEKEASSLAEEYQIPKDELVEKFGGNRMIKYDLEMRKTIELLKELNK